MPDEIKTMEQAQEQFEALAQRIAEARRAQTQLRDELLALIQRTGDVSVPAESENCKAMTILCMKIGVDVLAGEAL